MTDSNDTNHDTSPLQPRWLEALGIDPNGDPELGRRVRSWSEAEIERVLASPLQSAEQAPWLYLELIRRRHPIPGTDAFSAQLGAWSERSLTDALEVYAADYPLEQRAALLVEVLRRGLELGDPRRHPNQRAYQVCLSFTLLVMVLTLIFLGPKVLDTQGDLTVGTIVVVVFLALLTLLRPQILRRLKRMAGNADDT